MYLSFCCRLILRTEWILDASQLSWLQTKRRANKLTKILAGTMVTIQTTVSYQNFGRALALVMPIFWLG